MAHYVAEITSPWDAGRALAYMADFSNAVEWDPSVSMAVMTTPPPVRLGSNFHLVIQRGSRQVKLDYAVSDLSDSSVTLAARTKALESVDVISVRSEGTGCVLTYNATLRLRGPRRLADFALRPIFKRMADQARDRLERKLKD